MNEWGEIGERAKKEEEEVEVVSRRTDFETKPLSRRRMVVSVGRAASLIAVCPLQATTTRTGRRSNPTVLIVPIIIS